LIFDLCDFNEQLHTAQQFLPLMLIGKGYIARSGQRACMAGILICVDYFAMEKRRHTAGAVNGTCGALRCLLK
jgi:hypothetical protein